MESRFGACSEYQLCTRISALIQLWVHGEWRTEKEDDDEDDDTDYLIHVVTKATTKWSLTWSLSPAPQHQWEEGLKLRVHLRLQGGESSDTNAQHTEKSMH